jgi:hypothetical protein
LKVFEVSTLCTEGKKSFFCDWFPTLDFMLSTVDDFKKEFQTEADADRTFDYLAQCCEHSWAKIEKYYQLADQTPIVFAAVILNPTRKHHWFKQQWQSESSDESQRDWPDAVLEQVKELWRTQYKDTSTHQEIAVPLNEEGSLHIRLHNHKRLRLSKAALTDELVTYLETDPVPDHSEFDPIQWWSDRRTTFPDLFNFAMDCFSIPLMSDDPERSFSSGRNLITYRRSNLHDDIIEACSCLRSWYGPPVQAGASKAGEAAFDDEVEIEEQYKGLFTDNPRGTSDANGNPGRAHASREEEDVLS